MAFYSRRGTRGGVGCRYIPVYQCTGQYRQAGGEIKVRAVLGEVLDGRSVARVVANGMTGAESLNSHQPHFMTLSRNSLSSRS